jgi:Mn2+/Fe2+ NRAMP family transporter
VANGIIAPVIIICIVYISGQEKIMGEFKNSRTVNVIGWIIAILMSITAIGTFVSLFM